MLENRIKNRLRREVMHEITWQSIVQAFQNADQSQKNRLVEAVSEGNGKAVSRSFLRVMKAWVDAKVQTEYDQIMADGQLSAAELDRLFP